MTDFLQYKDVMIKIVEIYLPEAKIYLFGSMARGDDRWGSDVDIALDAGRRLTLEDLINVKRLLDALPIARKIDLVCVHRVPEEMRHNIEAEGIRWK
jgi:predicted nucleotidyltransferase